MFGVWVETIVRTVVQDGTNSVDKISIDLLSQLFYGFLFILRLSTYFLEFG